MQVVLFLLMVLLSASWLPGTVALFYWGNVHWLSALFGSFIAIEIGEAFLLFSACVLLPEREFCLAAI
ncbi:MAG: hypothetical protein AAB779_02995 [Patescibacteria group bacterium]